MRDGTGRPQRVVLLGGTSEIGLAVVRALDLAPGSTVVLAGRDTERARAAARTLPTSRVTVLPFEATNLPAHGSLLDEVFTSDVDLLIAAFGFLGDQQRAEADPEYAAETLTVNLLAHVSILLHAAQRMRRQGHGTLVVLSSIAAVRGRRANFVYGAGKSGLDAFASGLADSLHGSGVHLLLVRPGFVVGRMTAGMRPIPPSTTPDEVGRAVATALRQGTSTLYVPPSLRLAAWGIRLIPRSLWRRIPR